MAICLRLMQKLQTQWVIGEVGVLLYQAAMFLVWVVEVVANKIFCSELDFLEIKTALAGVV